MVKTRSGRQQEKRKTIGKIYRCSERGHAGGWCDRRGWDRWGEMEADDPLWRCLKGRSERRKGLTKQEEMEFDFFYVFIPPGASGKLLHGRFTERK